MAVSFEIYRDGERVTSFTPVGATAIGPESVPMPGAVSFRDGLLSVDRVDDHAVGVSLLWDLGPQGSYLLETTRLQHREQPYILNVELARLRLMKIVQKQEDWNLFDFARSDRFLAGLKEATTLLAEALGKMEQAPEAARLGDQALAMAVDLSEQLAGFHSDLLLNRRKSSGQFVKHICGCRVDSSVQNQRYKEMVSGAFDYAVVPMPWKQLQPEEHSFVAEGLDDWVETLARKRVPIIAGPLIRLHESDVPDWMFIWEHDFDTVRELAYEYVQRMVQRYRKAVAVWNVVAGLSGTSLFPMTFEQIIELTRLLVSQVKTILPNARTLVTITEPFGEYHARGTHGVPPMLYAEMVAQAGINFEGFGLELELGVPRPGSFMRDLFQISSMLDKFSTLNKPLFLTVMGVPGRWTPDPADRSEGKLDPSAGGRWRRPWDPQLQADWMDAVYKMALSKPYVESIAWGDLADIGHSLPGGGLMDDLFQPKPAFAKLQELRENFRQWSRTK